MLYKMNVVVMGTSGYPKLFSANNTKCEYIASGLHEAGCKVSIMDGLFGTKGEKRRVYGISGNGIKYCILPRKFKALSVFLNIPLAFRFLRDQKEKSGINHIILSTGYFPIYVMLVIIGRLSGYSLSVHITEWDLGMNYKRQIDKLNARILDRWYGSLVSLILPISHFLEEKSERFHKPVFLLPVLGSFSRISDVSEVQPHFTYCGHIGYLLRNKLVLEAFKKVLEQNHDARLVLVLSGNEQNFRDIESLLKKEMLEEFVYVKSQLPQKELYALYDSSIALLVPLDPNNLQDKARFSQKIAEYLTSKRPIITSAAGEIPYYFKDNENGVIVPFTSDGYCQGMLRVLNNRAKSDEIGLEGFKTGSKYFDYIKVGEQLAQVIYKVYTK